MKLFNSRHIGLLALQFGVVFLQAQVLAPMGNQAGFGNGVQNLRVLKQSADGSEATFSLDYYYDGSGETSARLFPVIADKSQQKISRWFGADSVTVPTGHGIISVKAKFFNDEPGAPRELTTDRVRIIMLTENGGSVIAQNNFSSIIKWGGSNSPPASVAQPAPAAVSSSFVLSSNFHTKISNVDIYSRNLDRSALTLSVDYDFAKEDGKPKMGVDFVNTGDPSVSKCFSGPAMRVSRGRHNTVFLPVKLDATADASKQATLSTDQIRIYLVDAAGVKSYIYQVPMVLFWHVPTAP
jgi:hypothetical protein